MTGVQTCALPISDLSHSIFAHAGTDVTRQMNRVKDPLDASSYGTAGPHSPLQVNWEMKERGTRKLPAHLQKFAAEFDASSARTGRIDNRIPVLGQMHQSRSRDQNSVTAPTAAAGIFEAISIATHAPQSIARPLTMDEATRLSAVLQQYGQEISVSEGIAPTIPRDANCAIRWDMLSEALDVIPAFPEKLGAAVQAMEEGRSDLLNVLADKINKGRADNNKVDNDWIITHRGVVLADAISDAQR